MARIGITLASRTEIRLNWYENGTETIVVKLDFKRNGGEIPWD